MDDGPPCMNRKITRLARAGNMGDLGTSGSSEGAALAMSAKRDWSPMKPKPHPAARSMPRRESCDRFGGGVRNERISISKILLVDKDEFVRRHYYMSKTGPRLLFSDLIPLLTEVSQVSESLIDLIGVRTTVEHPQVDFLPPALVLPLLLQHGIRHILGFANHQRTVHHEKRLGSYRGGAAMAFRSSGVAEVEQGVKGG